MLFLHGVVRNLSAEKGQSMNRKFLGLLIVSMLVFADCSAKENKKTDEKNGGKFSVVEKADLSFISVSMAEGIRMMKNDSDYVLLDVRRPDEFNEGHIPGAVLLTNETFTKEDAEELLKDKNQRIYVYCRSGRRSKQASQKLVDFGYTNVVEIGGILDYEGKVEK